MRIARSASYRILAVVLATTTTSLGCIGWKTSDEFEIQQEGKPLPPVDWASQRVWVRTFGHTDVTGVSNVYVAGYGGSASGIGVSRGRTGEVPLYLLHTLEHNGTFESVTTTTDVGRKPDLILEGESGVVQSDPWWTWVQLVDLWIHAWFFPTLGRDWTTSGEIDLYDADRKPIQSWQFRHEEHYIGTVWWAIGHGGSADTGFDVQRSRQTVETVLDRMNKDLK